MAGTHKAKAAIAGVVAVGLGLPTGTAIALKIDPPTWIEPQPKTETSETNPSK